MVSVGPSRPWSSVASVLSWLAALAVPAGAMPEPSTSTEFLDGTYVGAASTGPGRVAQVVQTFPSPAQYSMGLAWDGTFLWVCDGVSDGVIYRLDPRDGSILGNYDIPVHKLRGLTMGGGYLWTSSWDTEEIYKLTVAPVVIVDSFPAPFPGKPHGLTWDNGSLWIGEEGKDDEAGRIHRVDPATGAIERTISPPSGCCNNPRGIAWDGKALWVGYQATSGRIFRIDPATGVRFESFEAPSGPYQQGLTFDGQYLWSTGGDDIVYKIDVGVPLSVEGTPWAEVKAGYRP